ncbi:hypothetical protein HYD28_11940 [Pseudoalteromonas shioyasakiensis]|nr:hypothetical protein HYD28_11940 [Pseudoalteromonas shioyasakiensis]
MENKTLWKSKLLWSAIIIGVGIAVGSSIVIMNSTDNLVWCENSACFSSFLELFDFPLKALSATLFVAGFIAVIHRSEQTYHQIEIAREQNTFANYYEHKKKFIEMLSQFAEEHDVEIKGKSKLYKELFPFNNHKELELVSKGEQGGSSSLYYFIDRYNVYLSDLKLLFKKKPAGGEMKLNSTFCNLLDSFLILASQIGVVPKSTFQIDDTYKTQVKNNRELPKDFNNFIFVVGEMLEELAFFSFTNENAKNIKPVSISEYSRELNLLVENLKENPYEGFIG